MRLLLLLFALSIPFADAWAAGSTCRVWEDRNGNQRQDAGEPGLAGVQLHDGRQLVQTDADGRYRLSGSKAHGTLLLIKPATHALPSRADGLPDNWHVGGGCRDFALLPNPHGDARGFEVLLLADSQTEDATELDYFRRDIIEPLLDKPRARLGVTLGDLVDDNLTLYPQLKAQMARLATPWLHIPGNHDLDFEAADDAGSLLSYHRHFGPDTLAWEEPGLVFVGLDDVIYQPGASPRYVGGLREDQFAFLEAYLPSVPKDALLVLGVHIPLFDKEAGVETFRAADRKRLFALLRDFPHVLVLSGHQHTLGHHWHSAESGWHGAQPLHEFNVGAACGAFWSGAPNAAGIPDATMADGTPNGYARLHLDGDGSYRLSWHPAKQDGQDAAFTQVLRLHAPKVLRQGAYPAWGVYANVFAAPPDAQVEYRIDGGAWQPMQRFVGPDPWLAAENARDDDSRQLRGYDRSPEARASTHLWRAALDTRLPIGIHHVEVRAQDAYGQWQKAAIDYRLEAASR
ncbi:calcineurin phosphoesterase [Lysobacteraceae bacterium NML120232]|nr:calcineurin phosphoesterase [Xanthomonadaceae bacterium NML08-0793]PJK13206.1 calcineurin phosphoesterase [Xanthomonadaceae bacterium NML120232]